MQRGAILHVHSSDVRVQLENIKIIFKKVVRIF